MWKRAALSLVTVLALSASTWADAKDDAAAAIKKLGDSANYSWVITVEGGFGRPNSDCKTEKDGFTTFTAATQQDSYQVVMKGEKALAKGPGGKWMTTDDLQKAADDAGGFSDELITLLRIQNFQTPAAQAQDIAAKFQNVKKAADGSFTADLAEETAKGMLSFRRPAAATAPAATTPAGGGRGAGGFGGGGGGGGAGGFPDVTISNAKGTVIFWVKDGSISKMAVHLTGSRSFGGNDQDVDQTTTTEIKDVGATKVTVPDDVKTKLNAK